MNCRPQRAITSNGDGSRKKEFARGASADCDTVASRSGDACNETYTFVITPSSRLRRTRSPPSDC